MISADSMQAYRGMDIGTAKPAPELLERLPHRLIDIRDVKRAIHRRRFRPPRRRGLRRGRGLGPAPHRERGHGLLRPQLHLRPAHRSGRRSGDARRRSRATWPERGSATLRAELAAADPESAARIHENDVVSPNARAGDRPRHRPALGRFRRASSAAFRISLGGSRPRAAAGRARPQDRRARRRDDGRGASRRGRVPRSSGAAGPPIQA